ncbi:MAG: hypothetical protein R2771_08445 [Saprospiraceae bacterium]
MLLLLPGSTTAGFDIEVFNDNLKEDTETFTLQIGDNTTANAEFTPVDVEFTILNYTEGDLMIDMSWYTDALGVLGIDLSPTDAVDMILNVFKDGELVYQADGSSYESIVLPADAADGTYKVAASIYSSVNAGDFNEILPIDIELVFNQTELSMMKHINSHL